MRRKEARPYGAYRERDEPDWDYQYIPPTSIARDRSNAVERDRSSSTAAASHWNYNNDSIVDSQQSSSFSDSSPPPRQATTKTRRLSNLEVLCATHSAQEPESLYYKMISTNRAKTRSLSLQQPPPPKHRVVPKDEETPTISSMRKSLETNDIRRSMEQTLVERAESRKKQHEEDDIPIQEISFERQDETSLPPGCRLPSFRREGTKEMRRSNTNASSLRDAKPRTLERSTSERSLERKPRKSSSRKDTEAPIPPISEIIIEREQASSSPPPACSFPSPILSEIASRQENLMDSFEDSPPKEQNSKSKSKPSGIILERQEEKSPPPACELPSLIGPYFASPSIALPSTAAPSIAASTSTTASSQRSPKTPSEKGPPPPSATLLQRKPPVPKVPVMDVPIPRSSRTDVPRMSSTGSSSSEERNSPTSITDIVEELSDLQDQLDALRISKPSITKEAFVDAAFQAEHEELVDFPELISEEMMDGTRFQAFESGRDVPDSGVTRASTFSAFVDALHKNEPPVMEEAFIDQGVRIRRFDEEGDMPVTPDSSFSISVQEVSPRKEKKKNKTAEAEDRDSPEPFQSEPVKKKQVSKKQSRSKFKSSAPSSQLNESPRRKLMNLRGALASVRGRGTGSSSSQDTPVKAVRFSKNLITSMHYRPKTLPHEMDLLYFSSAELEELERDREERIYEEQFEVVAGPSGQEVSVTYPVRRKEKPVESEFRPTRLPQVEKNVAPPVPGLLDISDISSWSSSSEAEQQKQNQSCEI